MSVISMNKNKRSIVAMAVIGLCLVGCATVDDVNSSLSDARKQIDEKGRSPRPASHAVYVKRPPQDLATFSRGDRPIWAMNTVGSINAARVPFIAVADVIAKAAGVSSQLVDVNPSAPVSLSIPAGTSVGSAIEALSATSGFTPEFLDNSISWQDFVVRTYDLNTTVGENKISLGKDSQSAQTNSSQGGGQSGGENLVNLNTTAGQYNNVSGKHDIYADTVAALTTILGDKAVVSGSAAAGLITVSGRGSVMKLADSYMKTVQKSLRRQVQLQVQVVLFKSKIGLQGGVDWNLVYKRGDGTINFDTPGGVNSGSAPAKISISATGGALDGSKFIVDSLQEQGDVAVLTSPSAMLLNNRVGEIEVVETTPYNQRVKTTPNPDSGVSTETLVSSYNEGYTIYALPKIANDGDIFLHVTSELSSLVSKTEDKINEITQTFPTLSRNGFTQTMRLKSGETWVINGYKQTLTRKGDRTTFGIPLLGGQVNMSKDVVETLVLITPTIID